ncbi:7189_t:CDS:2 [Cetraspora pellucida]|uniref:7189_t:CDS:1 n=1 Tax=Cetraspora pellucida TaxID=1433469 RepID=A0A9N8VZM5_9GLOM|nr:7189_t:CDS:2 [Cetraspora pellucida]
MCGIFAAFNYQGDIHNFRRRALLLSKRIRHRGPNWSGCEISGNNIICHERLAIVGVESGAQPLTNDDKSIILSVNGEIYNHKTLRKQLKDGVQFKTRNRFIAARDPIGITTLYQGWSSKSPSTVYFASELKALQDDCDKIISFPPGFIYDSETGETTRYYQPIWWNNDFIPTTSIDYSLLRKTMIRAVQKRLMSDVPFGVLLSGGLDSSLIAAIATREAAKLAASQDGLEDDELDEPARSVAEFLGTDHHEYTFTIQEGLDALHDVIYHLETYDVTTIRASTPMYLLSRKISGIGVKMVLSGYLYFHNAPSAADFHKETVARVKNLHTSDCLRANKSTMAWGLEARVPFLDKDLLDVVMTIDPEEKIHKDGKMEKEQFSDGVGYSWIDSLRDISEKSVTDEQLANSAKRWPKDPPQTKEAYWYREQFDSLFPGDYCTESVVRWIPRKDWGCSEDPSGRAQSVHNSSYKQDDLMRYQPREHISESQL